MKKKPAELFYKDEKFLIKIGKNNRKFRAVMGMSQKMLASKIGVSNSQVSRMELGKVNFNILYIFRLAKALKIDPAELVL